MKLKTKFQDEDFELEEVADVDIATMPDGRIKAQARAKRGGLHTIFYKTKAEFDADWEDAPEEPNEFWFINDCGEVRKYEYNGGCSYPIVEAKLIGNYFETKEEAEKAVEKLKAWKRLKDKGFRFEGIKQDYTRFNQQEPMRTGRKYLQFNKSEDEEWMKENWKDLDICFGGEE